MQNFLINFILTGIPEALFLVVMTLILLNKFGMLDIHMWKESLKWIMIPTTQTAIMTSIKQKIIPESAMTIICIIFLYILMIYIIKRNNNEFKNRDYIKILICLSGSFFILGVIESITAPLILYLLNEPLTFINNNIVWNFIASIPSRIIEYLIIAFVIIKNNNVVKIRIFEMIFKNNFLLVSVASFTILSNVFAGYAIKLVGADDILEGKVSMLGQIFISMGILVIPAIILFWILLLINYILVKQEQLQQAYENLAERDDIML